MPPEYRETQHLLALARKTALFGIGYCDLREMDIYERALIEAVLD